MEVSKNESNDLHEEGHFFGEYGIEDSPSCCARKGVFYRELFRQLKSHDFSVDILQISPDYKEEDGNQEFSEELNKWHKG